METAHIYIYGDIGWWQSKDADDWGEVTLKGVRDQYESQKEAESITLHIHSPGGYVTEGFAIHDYIRSLKKPVITIIEGMCYSIATVIALAGDTRMMTSNSDFMIHNPWGGTMGDSEEVQKYADELKKIEQKVADFYAAKTKITTEEALQLMKDETFMTPEIALEKGFITEIATVMKAVALHKPNSNTMSKDTLTKDEAVGLLDGLAERIKNFLKPNHKNKIVQDANGEDIDFPELAPEDTPSVGDTATIGGVAAEGERVMPNGETFVFTAGELTEIKPAEDDSQNTEELQAENSQLKKDLKAEKKKTKALEKSNKDAQELVKGFKAEIKQIKASIGSNFKHDKGEKKNFKQESGESRRVFKEKED